MFSLFYLGTKRHNMNSSKEQTMAAIDNMQFKIDTQLQSVENSINNVVWLMSKDKVNEDWLFDVLKYRLINNKLLIECYIAFEPYAIQGKGKYYMLNVQREGNSIRCWHLGSDSYNYFKRDWYMGAKKLRRGYWSNPYFDHLNTQDIICTYSRPLFDQKGNIYAVFSVDIKLNDLTRIVNDLEPVKNSVSFLLNNEGYFISCRKQDLVLKETVFSKKFKLDEDYITIGRKMLAKERGYYSFDDCGTSKIAFYTPIKVTGWSLCNVCTQSAIFSDLHKRLLSIVLLFLFCIALFFTAMVSTSRRFITKLKKTTIAHERIKNELTIARSIQEGMIKKTYPPFPERKDIDLYAFLRPAKEVGGDLYDFLLVDSQLYFIIGDVSGKGVPASLFMSMALSLFRNLASHCYSPKEIAQNINETLSINNDRNMFATALIMRLELFTGQLTLCNAGHNPPLIVQSGNKQSSFMTIIKNLPVGLMSDFVYKEEEHQFNDGLIFLYTDGVTEAEGDHSKQFGEERLQNTINFVADKSSKEICDQVIDNIGTFVGDREQSDDITILAIKYSPLADKTE